MSDLILAEKRCTKCGETKPLSEFYRDKSRPGGHAYVCRSCARPVIDAGLAKRKQRLGEDKWNEVNRSYRNKSYRTGGADKRVSEANRLALRELARRHPQELAALTIIERAKLGLNPTPGPQGRKEPVSTRDS